MYIACETDHDEETDHNFDMGGMVFFVLVLTFIALVFIVLKLIKYRQFRVKQICSGISSPPTIRKVHGESEVTNRLPLLLIVLFLFVISVIKFPAYIGERTSDNENVEGWEVNKSRMVQDYVSLEKSSIIQPRNPCSGANSMPDILVIVCSAAPHYEQRSAIRHTWVRRASKYNISVIFLVGTSEEEYINENVRLESNTHEDIIVDNFIDSYNNLTLKSVLMLRWIKHHCNRVKYVMKADDDVYINLKSVSQFVRNLPEEKKNDLLTGRLYFREKPIKDIYSKWYVPCYMYPYKYYPSYVCGVGYIMATNVALRLYNESLHAEMVHLEDVFITGICAKKAGIQPEDNMAFHFFTSTFSVECNTVHPYMVLVSHSLSSSDMYNMHSQIERCLKYEEDRISHRGGG